MNKKSNSKELSRDSSNSDSNDSKEPKNFKVASRYLQSASNASVKMRTNLKPSSCPSPRHTISDGKSFLRMHSPSRKPLYSRGKLNFHASNQTLSGSVLSLAGDSKMTPQLHSTALYNADRTQCDDAFSTTIVKPPNRGIPKNLPNISAIVSDFKHSDSRESSEDSLRNENMLAQSFSEDDVAREYLMYLNAAYLRVGSEQTTQTQLKDAKYQMDFLNEVIHEESEKNLELRKLLQLVEHYEKTSLKYKLLKEILTELTGIQGDTETSLQTLSRALEYHLSRVKTSNIHLAEDQDEYSEQFVDYLKETLSILQKVNLSNEESESNVHKLMNLLENIQQQKKLIKTCQPLVERVSSLSLEEASLRMSLAELQQNWNS